MNSPYEAVAALIQDSKRLEGAASSNANAMATLLVGNLHRVNGSTLADLKRELARYNMHTGRWKK